MVFYVDAYEETKINLKNHVIVGTEYIYKDQNLKLCYFHVNNIPRI